MKRALGVMVPVFLSLGQPAAQASPPVASEPPAQVNALSPEELALVGNYEGGQTEVAARLILLEDHQFGFWLSYGALDEIAQGRWSLEGKRLILKASQFRTNNPYEIVEVFGEAILSVEEGSLTLQRHDRQLRFRRDE